VYDVVTIGSGTVDVFVRTKKTASEILKHRDHEDACFALGTKVLIEEIVHGTGGGGTNSAAAFSRLGFRTGWIGVLGDDHNGKKVAEALKQEKVRNLGVTKKGNTGFSVILVGMNHDRVILAHKGINDQLLPKDVKFPRTKWIYCGSMLGKSWNTLVQTVAKAKRRGIKIAFNPSLYLAKQGMKKLGKIVTKCDVLVFNKEEAKALLKTKGTIKQLMKKLTKHVDIGVITDGKRGAYASDGNKIYSIKGGKTKVVETTGAGDAFASGFVAGQMMGKDIATSLRMGQAEAESMLGAVGAKNDLLSRSAIMKKVRTRKYKVKEAKL